MCRIRGPRQTETVQQQEGFFAMQETGEKDRQTDALETRARSFGHDLKNILGGIIGFTELAMSQAPQDNPRLARFHQKIMESCSRAQGLVDQGLEFSRQKPQGVPQGSPDREEKGPAHMTDGLHPRDV